MLNKDIYAFVKYANQNSHGTFISTNVTAINEKNLKELSNITNGYYFREENLFELPEIASIEPSKIKLRREADLWSSPLYLIVLLIPITLEWFMRKFAELK